MLNLAIQLYCGNILVADGTDDGGIVEELAVNGTRVIQETQPLRADWITVFGRGNRKNTIALQISMDRGSVTAALLATLQQNDNLPVKADLVLNFTETGVGSFTARIAGAGWNPINTRFIGRSSITQLTVIGGQCIVTAGVGIAVIDGGPFDAPDFELPQGWPVDGGSFWDRRQEAGYLMDAGAF